MRTALVSFILIVFAAPVFAATKYPISGDKLTDNEMAAFNAMTAQDDNPPSIQNVRIFTMAPWLKATQPYLVVAAMASEQNTFTVAVLKANGKRWTVIAITDTENAPVIEPADATTLQDLSLDMISYHISKGEVAFGVRVSTGFNSTSTNAYGISLHLFQLHDQQLNDIFATEVASDDCDKTSSNEDCKEDKSIVQFASTMHDGYYDILVKPAKKGSKRENQHYIWKNGIYVYQGE